MHDLTKKRVKAILIDTAITMAVSLAVEQVVRKKVKNKAVYDSVMPSLMLWGLEYAQLRLDGQTVGHKAMGIKIESEDGGELTSGQILKRVIHRDTKSNIDYLLDRKKYDGYAGTKFPHDLYAHTIIKEKL